MIISIISQITTDNTSIYSCYTSMYTNYCGGSISFCFNKNPHELHLLQHQLIPLGSPGARTTNLCRVPEGISCNTRICIKTWRRRAQLIGLRENLQENPIFHGKIYGFRLRFSHEKSTHWRAELWCFFQPQLVRVTLHGHTQMKSVLNWIGSEFFIKCIE